MAVGKGLFRRCPGVYDVFVHVVNRKTHQKLKKIVPDLIGPDDTVLECACGTGLLSAVIAPKCRRALRDGGSVYVADLSKRCIHIVDALLHRGHAEEALFTLGEFEAEANRRGFATVHKTSDLGLEGYFRFRKEKTG